MRRRFTDQPRELSPGRSENLPPSMRPDSDSQSSSVDEDEEVMA